MGWNTRINQSRKTATKPSPSLRLPLQPFNPILLSSTIVYLAVNVMKKQFIIPLLPVLLLACGQGSSTTDSANDAAGTGSPFEARRVTGTRLLTTDYKYDKICNLLDE